jgi:hypothetical protein
MCGGFMLEADALLAPSAGTLDVAALARTVGAARALTRTVFTAKPLDVGAVAHSACARIVVALDLVFDHLALALRVAFGRSRFADGLA